MADVRVVVVKSFTEKSGFTRLKGEVLVVDEGRATALVKAKLVNIKNDGEVKNEKRGRNKD